MDTAHSKVKPAQPQLVAYKIIHLFEPVLEKQDVDGRRSTLELRLCSIVRFFADELKLNGKKQDAGARYSLLYIGKFFFFFLLLNLPLHGGSLAPKMD